MKVFSKIEAAPGHQIFILPEYKRTWSSLAKVIDCDGRCFDK